MRNQQERHTHDYPHAGAVLSFLCFIALAVSCLSYPAEAGILSEDIRHQVIIQSDDASKALRQILLDWQKTLNKRAIPDNADSDYGHYRFEKDRAALKKLLQAEGYYQSTIEAAYDEAAQISTFRVGAGQQYRFGRISMEVEAADEVKLSAINVPDTKVLSAKTDKPALAAVVLKDVLIIQKSVEKHNCLFDHHTTHEAVINHLQHRIDVTYRVKAGLIATFGDIQFIGQETISNLHLNRRVQIKKGECFKRSKLNDANVFLKKSGLLAKTETVLPESPAADGSVPVTFIVTERAHRSIKAGVSYSTDIGPGVNAGWEHRNFLSHGENFSTMLSVATREQQLNTQLEKPYFMRRDQRLKVGGGIEQKDNDAFQTSGFNVSGGVERDLDNKWMVGVGAKYGFERIKDQNNTENVALFSLPLFMSQDRRNDRFNPISGWTFQFNTTPAVDTIDTRTTFLKNRVSGGYYQPLGAAEQSVIAVRATTGAILGASSDTVPATERFYTGGGGSIRGYGYQLVGPLDTQNDPLGGRSFVEFSTELRLRIAEDHGVVAFLDGGNTFDATYPDFYGGVLWGAGLGYRYFTSFAPLRVDVAVPLDKRSGVDDAFQLYFSIGQAF